MEPNQMRGCATCVFQDTDRGFCWCPERGAFGEEPVFSEVTQQTEAEGRVHDESCQYYYHR